MILTEEEAKTKWCPDARVLAKIESPALSPPANVTAITSCNRGVGGEHAGFCIGSACMAWRWQDGEHEFLHVAGDFCLTAELMGRGWKQMDDRSPVSTLETYGNKPKAWRINQHRRGYCGKAGKP